MDIRFISLNVWLGGKMLEPLLSFLKEQNADIIALQEVYNGEDVSLERQYRSMQVLKEVLDYPYEAFIADYRDFDRTYGRAQRGNAVLSKFPVQSNDAVFFNEPYSETYRDVPGNYQNCPRDLQHVVLQTPIGLLDVYNIQGVWDIDGDNYSEERKRMADIVIESVKEKSRVILAGDTNAKPSNQAIVRIESHVKNVFPEPLATTFNMRRKDNPGYATAAVDMILVSPSFEVLRADCPDVDISDHLPLLADLRIR